MEKNDDCDAQDFTRALQYIYKTDRGKLILDALKEEYIDASCLSDTPEITYYKLGQKELIQQLHQTATLETDDDNYVEEIKLED